MSKEIRDLNLKKVETICNRFDMSYLCNCRSNKHYRLFLDYNMEEVIHYWPTTGTYRNMTTGEYFKNKSFNELFNYLTKYF